MQQDNIEDDLQHELGNNAVLLKYVRLGAVQLDVSTSGYKIFRFSEFPVRMRVNSVYAAPAAA